MICHVLMLGFVGFPHAYKQDSHSCWMYVKSNYALLLQLNVTMRPLPRFSFLVYNEFRTHIRSGLRPILQYVHQSPFLFSRIVDCGDLKDILSRTAWLVGNVGICQQ